jgi:hypothetical protein
MRILKPWLLASAAGFSIGAFLLQFDPASAGFDSSDHTPRAVRHSSPASPLTTPVSTAASLATPATAPSAPGLELTTTASHSGSVPAQSDTP